MKKHAMLLLALLFTYLGLYNGRVALWTEGKDTPDKVFPYAAELFPQADREALERGIPCPAQEDIDRLLQDYLS